MSADRGVRLRWGRYIVIRLVPALDCRLFSVGVPTGSSEKDFMPASPADSGVEGQVDPAMTDFGELLGLHWSDIDVQDHDLTVQHIILFSLTGPYRAGGMSRWPI